MNTSLLQFDSSIDMASSLLGLSSSDDPTPGDCVNWFRCVLRRLDSWDTIEPEDTGEFGRLVRNAGKLCAYLGLADLYQNSVLLAPEASSEVFGAPTPVCSEVDANAFLATCIGRCEALMPSSAAATGPAPSKSDVVAEMPAAPLSDELSPRYIAALEWEKQAKIRLGQNASDQAIYDWAVTHRDQFDWPLHDIHTFRRYLRNGRKWLRDRAHFTLPSEQPR